MRIRFDYHHETRFICASLLKPYFIGFVIDLQTQIVSVYLLFTYTIQSDSRDLSKWEFHCIYLQILQYAPLVVQQVRNLNVQEHVSYKLLNDGNIPTPK